MSSDEDMPLSAITKSGTTGIAPGRVKTVSAKQRQGQRIEDAVEERQRLQTEEAAEEAAEEPGPPQSSSKVATTENDGAESEEGGDHGGEGEESGEEGFIWDETHKARATPGRSRNFPVTASRPRTHPPPPALALGRRELPRRGRV